METLNWRVYQREIPYVFDFQTSNGLGQINYDFCYFTRCTLNSKGSKELNFERNYTQLKFKQGTVEKNWSTIGLLAGIEPTLL